MVLPRFDHVTGGGTAPSIVSANTITYAIKDLTEFELKVATVAENSP